MKLQTTAEETTTARDKKQWDVLKTWNQKETTQNDTQNKGGKKTL